MTPEAPILTAILGVFAFTAVVLAILLLSYMRRAATAEAKLRRLVELYQPKRITQVAGLLGGNRVNEESAMETLEYIMMRTTRTREVLGIDDPRAERGYHSV